MKAALCVIFYLLFGISLSAQNTWSWDTLHHMPEPVSNNAVAAAMVNGNSYVYSFSGIDTCRCPGGIHLKTWKYDVAQDQWSVLPSVPDTAGKIAAAATYLNNIVYVIGGYHVAPNFSEKTSTRVHRFNTLTDTWMTDGSPVPVPVDDHVQALWRDSLIYLITGWSNTGNVANVQIYDPDGDSWAQGTPVPNSGGYKAFGAAGIIQEDTIWYAGGLSSSFGFPNTNYLRKGVINPANPTDISWSNEALPLAQGYRMGANNYYGRPLWFGGSLKGYNFDGIAYDGSGPVAPLNRVLVWDDSLYADEHIMPGVMDLRGVARIGAGNYVLAGGTITGPEVTDRVVQVNVGSFSPVQAYIDISTQVYPNPSTSVVHISAPNTPDGRYSIYTIEGKRLLSGVLDSSGYGTIPLNTLLSGMYVLKLEGTGEAVPIIKL